MSRLLFSMGLLLRASFVVTMVASCKHQGAEVARIALRDEARLVLERHCGNCHIPESTAAIPAALTVYNLRDDEWASHMSTEQLNQLGWRIREGEFFDEFDVRNKGKAPPQKPSEQEQGVVRDYVTAELGARARL